MSDQEAENTDRELWREREGDYYADKLFVTKGGGIGMDCAGHVKVRPVRTWHEMDATIAEQGERIAVLEARNERLREKYRSGYSSGFSDGYLQAEFDCEAMGHEAFLRQADGLRQSQASILNQQHARISALEAALGEAGEALRAFAEKADELPENMKGDRAVVVTADKALPEDILFSSDLRKAKAVREKIMGVMQPSENAETKGSATLPNVQTSSEKDA